MRRVVTLCVLASAAAAIGCGGGDHGSATAPRIGTATSTTVATVAPPAARPSRARRVAALRPPIVHKPIALTARRRRETVAYALRHYGLRTDSLVGPHVIVEHYTATPDVPSTYAIFAADTPDVELHELPGLCSHFVVDRDGTIYQLAPLTFLCRHTVGLNYTALGIEHVGSSDSEILSNAAQMRASLRLTRWLRCRSHIPVKDVIGHNESLGSPYHHEDVAALRRQTHADWRAADMRIYRARLAALGPC
jgi:hypothetical protein